MCYNGPRKVITVRIPTERKRPTPVKMTLAGENTWDIYKRVNLRGGCPEAYQANTRSKNVREGGQNVDRGIKPFRPSFVGTPGLIEALYLLLKKSKNGSRRIACLQLRGEWMSAQIVPRA